MEKVIASVHEAIEEMHDFNREKYKNYNRVSYSLLMENKEQLVLHKSSGQPCYGDLRVYSKGEHKPWDLKNPFPDGTPVAIGIPFASPSLLDGYRNFVINSPESPWHDVLHEVQPTYDEKESLAGFVITDTNVDPTALINLFMFCRNGDLYYALSFNHLVKEGIEPRIALMISQVYQFSPYATHMNPYVLNNVNARKFFNGDFRKEPDTFRNRFPYRRKGLEYLFSHSEKKFPHIFKLKELTLNIVKEEIVPFLEAQIKED